MSTKEETIVGKVTQRERSNIERGRKLTKPKKLTLSLVGTIGSILFPAVVSAEIWDVEHPSTSEAPAVLQDGWSTNAFDNTSLSAEGLRNALAELGPELGGNVHSLLIVSGGELVYETYWSGYPESDERYLPARFELGELLQYDPHVAHPTKSFTKSVTGTLVGIAIEQGYIGSIDDSIWDYVPNHADLRNAENDDITIKDLLTMTAGFSHDEISVSYADPNNPAHAARAAEAELDNTTFTLTRAVVAEPGAEFEYNSGLSNLLGEIIKEATGQRADEFAEAHLFRPLNIIGARYLVDSGEVDTQGGLTMRPRDMAKIGWVHLNDGLWQGNQVVPSNWVEDATSKFIDTPWDRGYGYQWFTWEVPVGEETYYTFQANGYGNQFVFGFPELDLVIAGTAGNWGNIPVFPEVEFDDWIRVSLVPQLLGENPEI